MPVKRSESSDEGMEDDWRQNCRTQQEKLEYVIDHRKDEYGDTDILVGPDKERIRVISAFLEVNSPVLKQKLSEVAAGVPLHLEDVQPDHFRMLVKAMYTGRWSKKQEDAIPLLVIAEKYKADLVVQECTIWLQNTGVQCENAIQLYQDSKRYSITSFADWAWNFILEHGTTICQSPTFKDLTEENLIRLAKEDDLKIDNETLLLDAVEKWGKEQIQLGRPAKRLNSVLTNVIPHLRLYYVSDRADSAFRMLTTEQHTHLKSYATRSTAEKNSLLENPTEAIFNTKRRNFYKDA